MKEINLEIDISKPRNKGNIILPIEDILIKLIKQKSNINNLYFEINNDLQDIANLLIKAIINVAKKIDCKTLDIIIKSYKTFKDIVNNLLFDIEPKEWLLNSNIANT